MPEAIQEVWAICELMGHVRVAGRLSEEEKFGAKMGRLDIPTEKPCDACAGDGFVAFLESTPCPACKGAKVERGFITQYFGGGSVYRISIVTEAAARHAAKGTNPAPISAWDFPKAALLSPAKSLGYGDHDEADDERQGF